MKVTCEYCGSYVETDENMRCPHCLAGLGDAVQVEQERIVQQEAAQREAEAAEKAQEAKEAHVSEVIKGVTSVASAVLAGVTASGASKHARMDDGRPPEPPEGRNRHARMDGPEGRERHARLGGPGGQGGPGGGHARMGGGPGGPGGPGGRR